MCEIIYIYIYTHNRSTGTTRRGSAQFRWMDPFMVDLRHSAVKMMSSSMPSLVMGQGEAQQRTACGPSAVAQRTEALYFGAGEWQCPARLELHGVRAVKVAWHYDHLDLLWFAMFCFMIWLLFPRNPSFGESLGKIFVYFVHLLEETVTLTLWKNINLMGLWNVVSPTFTIIYPAIIILIDRVATCNCSPLIYLLYLTSPPIGLLLLIFAIQRFKNIVDGRPNRPFEVFWHWFYEITITLFLHSW